LRPTIVLEAVLATIFVLSAWLIGGLVGFAVYAIALSVYVVARRGPIMRGVGRLRVIAADG
jgi:type IV secretory pathway TrbD component